MLGGMQGNPLAITILDNYLDAVRKLGTSASSTVVM